MLSCHLFTIPFFGRTILTVFSSWVICHTVSATILQYLSGLLIYVIKRSIYFGAAVDRNYIAAPTHIFTVRTIFFGVKIFQEIGLWKNFIKEDI
ncbi:hypothetical protein A2W16_01500 [Candidatus Amesbacteria bacterium RBG_16_48_31]|nr:MAG: hypothetical protein A2W16_01500 [Candidatus Amesbacteria bacterium RBG_16_48_31]